MKIKVDNEHIYIKRIFLYIKCQTILIKALGQYKEMSSQSTVCLV